MIQIISGVKGKGKTKYLIQKANEEVKNANGNVVYLDKNNKHMYELSNKIRLINLSEYPLLSLIHIQMCIRDRAGIDTYTSGDIVGKTGLEKSFEDELHGEKGKQTVYVDSLGSILEVAERVESSPGNNLYLTIDKDYQIQAYNCLLYTSRCV